MLSSREGLTSQAVGISTVADNLSNLNSTAFKAQRPEFSDLLADSIGSLYGSPLNPGDGAKADDVRSIFTQGALEGTERQFDFGVQGNGFFILNDGTDTTYTRAGNFSVDNAGNLVASTGENVMGFTAASPTALTPLNVGTVTSTPTPTTTMTIIGNLDATLQTDPTTGEVVFDTVPANPADFQEITDASSFNSSASIIDSLGQTHEVGLQFFHTAANTWTVQAYVDGAEVGGTPGVPTSLGSQPLTFQPDGSQGVGTTNVLTLSGSWSNGANASSVAVDISGFSQFATASGITGLTQDGKPAGNLLGFSVDDNGVLSAQMSNGGLTALGTVVLADFVNPEGLERIGDAQYIETDESGTAEVGAPNAEGRGLVKNSVLESSTVDQAAEFINLVRYQRAYQANSQVLTTLSGLVDQTIQIL